MFPVEISEDMKNSPYYKLLVAKRRVLNAWQYNEITTKEYNQAHELYDNAIERIFRENEDSNNSADSNVHSSSR